MLRAVALLALFACGDPAIAAPPETPAEPTPEPEKPKGQVVVEKLRSKALGVDKTVHVYLPAGYDPKRARRWPVFYYLHGLGGKEANWLELGKLDQAADDLGLQAIVVMPDGDNHFYVDSKKAVDYDGCMRDGVGMFDAKQSKESTCTKAWKYETYITRDLVGWVDRKFKTIASRDGRAIAGLSMGGYGALMLAMRHQDMFAAAASHSGVDALLYGGPYPYEPGKVTLIEDPKEWGIGIGELGTWMRGLFGNDIKGWRAHDPAALAAKLAPGKLKLYLDCGTEDEFMLYNGMQYLHELLLAKKIDHEYWLGPGRHSFKFWKERLPHSLRFLSAAVVKPS